MDSAILHRPKINGHYSKIVPSTFVHNKYEEEKVENFITRQKVSKKHLINPWSVLLLDDCTDDPRIFNKPIFQGLYKLRQFYKVHLVSLNDHQTLLQKN